MVTGVVRVALVELDCETDFVAHNVNVTRRRIPHAARASSSCIAPLRLRDAPLLFTAEGLTLPGLFGVLQDSPLFP
jgi:hypothetical protein